MLWTEKYRPKFEEILGQDEAKKELKNFVLDFFRQRKNSAMVYGPSGTGKTAAIYALATKMNFEVIELNASDFRDKKQIHNIIGSSLSQKSLFSRGKIILIDEIEALNSRDYGAITEMLRLIEKKVYPVIFIANDAWQEKIRKLRTKSKIIKFMSLEKEKVIAILKKITKEEKIKLDQKTLEIIAARSMGDARAAINDLQTIFIDKKIIKENIMCLGFREKDENIFQALRQIFKTKIARGAFDNVQLDLDMIILWLDENIPIEYSGRDLIQAYEALSIADVFRGRIIRRQHWHFLSYVNILISQGVAIAKKKEKNDFTSYKPPSRILKMWIAKQKLQKKKSIAEKFAKVTHISQKQALQDFSFIELFLKNQIPKELKLTEKEIEFLEK